MRSARWYAIASLGCDALLIAAVSASRYTDSPFFPPAIWWMLLTWVPIASVIFAVLARSALRGIAEVPSGVRWLVRTAVGVCLLYLAFVAAFFIGELMGHE